MKKLIFTFAMILSVNVSAESFESCEDILTNHISIVEMSEKYISSLVLKKNTELTAYDIDKLQKNLTNRFLHLTKTIDMYKETEGVLSCSPGPLGEALAIYDFSQLGKQALNDTKLRRIIFNFTKFPRYQLTQLKKLYDRYTSDKRILHLLEKINEEKIVLPSNLVINSDVQNEGDFFSIKDMPLKGAGVVISSAAKVWGFISDKLKWRNGHLNENAEALQILQGSLKPLDLLYEKRTFVLSNYTIPGHWGHVAVWLGTKEELIQMGIWDEEFFEPFRKAIEEGKNIIEFRKQGINFVALHDFLNLDEIAVTRMSNVLPQAQAFSVYEEMSEQLDKTYDFTFNMQTSDKITCSEFVAYSFGDIRWPETLTLGQVNIRPDDIALLTLYKNSPAEFVLYLKGKKDQSFEQKSFDDWKQLFEEKAMGELVYQ